MQWRYYVSTTIVEGGVGGGVDYVHYLGAHWPLWPPTATMDQCVDLTGTSGIATWVN